jgi:uncharacterized protein GlcG (DUF336 family)
MRRSLQIGLAVLLCAASAPSQEPRAGEVQRTGGGRLAAGDTRRGERPAGPVEFVNPADENRPKLLAADVDLIVRKAAESANSNQMVIAVTDRQGDILALYRKPGAPAESIGNFSRLVDTNELAVALARTAGFFSNSQAPLSSRTVRFISGVHFPPGISFTPNAALYGIENTNRGCLVIAPFAQSYPFPRSIDQTRLGLGIITGKKDLFDSDPKAVNPGGVPIYKGGEMVGGIGVAGVPPELAEYAAFTGSAGAGFLDPSAIPAPGVVYVDGIALPFVNQTTAPNGIAMGTFDPVNYLITPRDAPKPAPEGDLILPRAGPLGGLTQADVRKIIDDAVAAANQTRGVIRLPLGSRSKMVIAVADLDGQILALHRMPDATFFSVDVAITKSRNVIYFSGPERTAAELPGVPMGTAINNRAISFGAQPFFPPGLDYTKPGPFFELYKQDVEKPCTQGAQKSNPQNQSGIIFFPGALALYRDGKLVGGLGVSGDGVEQDDYVTAQAAKGYEPPDELRVDRVKIDGVRLPYLKFPRNPTF